MNYICSPALHSRERTRSKWSIICIEWIESTKEYSEYEIHADILNAISEILPFLTDKFAVYVQFRLFCSESLIFPLDLFLTRLNLHSKPHLFFNLLFSMLRNDLFYHID